jgi:hypothetical protein
MIWVFAWFNKISLFNAGWFRLRVAGVWQVWGYEDEYADNDEEESSMGLIVLVPVLGFFPIVPHNPINKQLLYEINH